ncbi:MAG: hypothetical protein AAGJ54_02715 [Planctomycetota bacterium]
MSGQDDRDRAGGRAVRRAAWAAWALAPVAVLAFHAGPGQAMYARERAAAEITEASQRLEAGAWLDAVSRLDAALAELPEDDAGRAALRLELAAAKVHAGEVIEGTGELDALLQEIDAEADPEFAASVRAELATAHYYAAWIMRLEGATPDEWREESGKAKQHFRLLAEAEGDEGLADASAKNLESVIRLERMDLSELEGLPLPKDCPGNCDGLSQRKRDQRISRNKNKKKDGREKIQSDGASAARRNGSGS